MNKIGFRNFRRFKDFPALEYGGITFLVGRNNAGKSTLVKALLLMDHYFKSGDIHQLSFGNSILEDANIVTYGRALNNSAKVAGENFIYFEQQAEDYIVQLTVSGEEEQSFATVQKLVIRDMKNYIEFNFNIANNHLTINKNLPPEKAKKDDQLVSETKTKIAAIQKQLRSQSLEKASTQYIEIQAQLEALKKVLKGLRSRSNRSKQERQVFTIDANFSSGRSLSDIVAELIQFSVDQYNRDFADVQKGRKPSERFEDLRALKIYGSTSIQQSFERLITAIKSLSVSYLGANPSKQSALFSIRDINNALSQAIHEYKQLDIPASSEERRFVVDWMERFDVGSDFDITMHAGEAYEMKVYKSGHWIHIADLGMGSIQAMLLIMRLACIIRKSKLAAKESEFTELMDEGRVQFTQVLGIVHKTIVVIEEPELNLHPGLQSRLADLFFYVHDKYHVDFLIETHSEYAIRKSQVWVADKNFEVPPNENPFKVYYFDNEDSPYRMPYREDGRFTESFGSGFFDVSANLTFDLP